jgi:hypothetical protein
MCLSHNTLKPRLEPLDRVILVDFVARTNSGSGTAAACYSGTGSGPTTHVSTYPTNPNYFPSTPHIPFPSLLLLIKGTFWVVLTCNNKNPSHKFQSPDRT